jgi:hypothetical protein
MSEAFVWFHHSSDNRNESKDFYGKLLDWKSGAFQIEAAISAVHCRARTAEARAALLLAREHARNAAERAQLDARLARLQNVSGGRGP